MRAIAKIIGKDTHMQDYMQYRRRTGKCETCYVEMKHHPKCDGCSILTGVPHPNSLSPYHENQVCGSCFHSWKVLERLLEREITFGEFQNPPKFLMKEIRDAK